MLFLRIKAKNNYQCYDMDKIPITRQFCLDYVIEALAIGDPIVHRIFETVNQGKWIDFCSYTFTADIIYNHCIQNNK